jgi:hypothetical protein
VVFLTRNGYLAFAGPPAQARQYFGVDDLAEVYRRLASEGTPQAWAERFAACRQPGEITPQPVEALVQAGRPSGRRSPGALRQWWLLTRRRCPGAVACRGGRRSNSAQAALALPMLCFPQVLFAGAVVPAADMAAPGRLLSLGLASPPCLRGRQFRRRRYQLIANFSERYVSANLSRCGIASQMALRGRPCHMLSHTETDRSFEGNLQ